MVSLPGIKSVFVGARGVSFHRTLVHVPWLGPKLIAFGSIFVVSLLVLLIAATLFWLWMLIDCLARDYREFGTLVTSDKSADKLVWVLLILFLPVIGAIAYHISVRRRPVRAEG